MGLALLMVIGAAPGTAHAGRSFFGWLYGPEVLPERGVELQQWLWEEDDKDGPAHARETQMWWAPTIGVTDQLEVSLPVVFAWQVAQAESPSFTLASYGIDVRYRLVSQDPVDKPAFAPLVRVALSRDVTSRDGIIGAADLVGAYDITADVQAAIDLGVEAEVHEAHHPTDSELHAGVGLSVKAVGDVRFGAEAFTAISLQSSTYSWAAVGPDIAVTHGRFWLSAAFGIGVYHISYAPRMMWGVLF